MTKFLTRAIVAGSIGLGTLGPLTVVLAASANVQAALGQSEIAVNRNVVATKIAKLVYGGTTYIQLYSVEQALKKVGISPSWDGQTFNMDTVPNASARQSIELTHLVKSATSSGSTFITGVVMNHDSVKHSVILSATFFDNEGKLVGQEVGSVQDVPSGQSLNFQTLPTGNYVNASTYTVQVQSVM